MKGKSLKTYQSTIFSGFTQLLPGIFPHGDTSSICAERSAS